MSPTERAEALGWQRGAVSGFWTTTDEVIVWASASRTPRTWWPCPRWLATGRLPSVGFGTEDEALAVVLELRDVVLS